MDDESDKDNASLTDADGGAAAESADNAEMSRQFMEDGVPEAMAGAKPATAGDDDGEASGGDAGEDDAGEKDDEDQDEGDEDQEDGDDKAAAGKEQGRKTLPPEAQAILEKRIGKEVAKRKTLESALEHERNRAGELEARLTQQAKGEPPAPAAGAGPSRVLLATTEQEVDAREDRLWEIEAWCESNRGGYEGADPDKDPSYTPEQIAAKLVAVRRERERDVPRARANLAARTQHDTQAKQVYPELWDREKPAYGEAQRILREVPEIRARPDAMMLIGDMLAGKALRVQKAAGRAGATPKRAPDIVPEARSTAVSRGPGKQSKDTQKGKLDAFAAGGFDDDALEAAMR